MHVPGEGSPGNARPAPRPFPGRNGQEWEPCQKREPRRVPESDGVQVPGEGTGSSESAEAGAGARLGEQAGADPATPAPQAMCFLTGASGAGSDDTRQSHWPEDSHFRLSPATGTCVTTRRRTLRMPPAPEAGCATTAGSGAQTRPGRRRHLAGRGGAWAQGAGPESGAGLGRGAGRGAVSLGAAVRESVKPVCGAQT